MIDLYIRIEGHDNGEVNRQMVFTGADLRDVFDQAGKYFAPILSPEPAPEVVPEVAPEQSPTSENAEGR